MRSQCRRRSAHAADGAYAYAVSKVKRRTTAPNWTERLELELQGGGINRDGCFSCPDAALTALRLEVWHRLPWAVDAFLGEVTVPLVPLMDLAPRTGWHSLSDPQGKAELPVKGQIFLEMQFTTIRRTVCLADTTVWQGPWHCHQRLCTASAPHPAHAPQHRARGVVTTCDTRQRWST